MNKEQLKFKRVMKQRKLRKDFEKRKNVMNNNVERDSRTVLSAGLGLPASRKFRVVKKKKKVWYNRILTR